MGAKRPRVIVCNVCYKAVKGQNGWETLDKDRVLNLLDRWYVQKRQVVFASCPACWSEFCNAFNKQGDT